MSIQKMAQQKLPILKQIANWLEAIATVLGKSNYRG